MNNEYLTAAKEKLASELPAVKGQKESVIAKPVADALIIFSQQEPEFAQAIAQNDKTLSDCCKEISKDISQSNAVLSDIEAYRRAVSFYFPGAGVRMEMKIDLCASVNTAGANEAPKSKIMRFDLSDLL